MRPASQHWLMSVGRSSRTHGPVPGDASCATAARARFCRRRRRSGRPLEAARCLSGTPDIVARAPVRSRAGGRRPRWPERTVCRPTRPAALSRVLDDDAPAAPASSPASRGVLEQLQRKPHRAGIGGGSRGWLRTGHGHEQYHEPMNHDTVGSNVPVPGFCNGLSRLRNSSPAGEVSSRNVNLYL